MGIQVNPSVWSSVFAVPTAVTDEHLRRASGQQLKVLLFVLRHNGENPDDAAIAEGTGLTKADASDALAYWFETGFFNRDGETSETRAAQTTAQQPATPVEEPKVNRTGEETKRHELLDVPDVLPTYDQVTARTMESPELQGLFNEAQIKLGKTIGYDTQAKLLMLMDSYGLPPEVILTIIEYSVSHGKRSMAYICKVGKNWAEDGIDTLEKAEERLKSLSEQEKLWKQFTAKIPVEKPHYTQKRMNYLRKWHDEFHQSLDLICYGYEEMINNINKLNFNYLDKMLTNWHEKKLETPVDVMQDKKGITQAGGTGPASRNKPSYDTNLFKKKATGPIAYKKRSESDAE